jgi:glycyl-tRNA synthetase beta chain
MDRQTISRMAGNVSGVDDMTDFLLELRSEEIPARMQAKAKDDLARLFTESLAKAGLGAESIETFATPRRLALIAKGLPLATDAVSEETKGPKVGAPPQALEGFLRKIGLTQDQLVERDGAFFAIVEKPGRKTADVLAEAIPAIIRAFPWPKSQRWGAASLSTESLRWVRPLQGIIALLGDDVVDCAIEGIVSGRETMGHRFHSTGPITITNAAAYVEALRAAHVIVHYSERTAIIRDGAAAAAKAAGLVLVEDEGLVAENAGLTEWPVPMLGRFDPAFLDVPQEVIQLTARVNQKYFICRDGAGKLANAFICTANIVARDGGAAIVAGNEKVLAARLSDAKFFWEQDLKVPLDKQAEKLSNIVFHEKLGTVADKVERVAKLARWLVASGVIPAQAGTQSVHEQSGEASGDTARLDPGLRRYDAVEALADMAERAARLCKADLVTGMVGEFPELQGIMGGYYARAQGEPDAVADAVRDHYKPVGQGDDVPTAPVTVAVSLADKLDTLVGFFFEGMPPTGSKDPFALRRSGIGIILLILDNCLRIGIEKLLANVIKEFVFLRYSRAGDATMEIVQQLDGTRLPENLHEPLEKVLLASFKDKVRAVELADIVLFRGGQVKEFLVDRLKVQQREAGVRHDLIDAVFALGGEDDLVRLLARVKALQAFVTTDEGTNLLAGYKRAANILKSSPERGGGGEADGGVPSSGQSGAGGNLGPLHHPADGSPPRAGEELALESALNTAEPRATSAIAAEDFEAAMTALASLRAPIDAFFEGVMVNDPDPDKRAYRLGLLSRFRDAVHKVADFSKIEG